MSSRRGDVFVGFLRKDIWNEKKLRAYLNAHISENGENCINRCDLMSYKEPKFKDYYFAFVKCKNEHHVDRCMAKRDLFYQGYHLSVKRLLPDSIRKCERLGSSEHIVIRLPLPDDTFTEENIRSHFGRYGTIQDFKMLEEDGIAGMCLITFADSDSSDRVLLDLPHYLNGQLLEVHKYLPPEVVCGLYQYSPIPPEKASHVKHWYPIYRNLSDFVDPLIMLHKTQLALALHNHKANIALAEKRQFEWTENLRASQEKCNQIKSNLLQSRLRNEQLKKQIDETQRKTNQLKTACENEIDLP